MKISMLMLAGMLSSASVAGQDLKQQLSELWQAGDFAAAKALLAPQVNSKTKDAALLAYLGRTEAGLNNMATAEELLAKAVKLTPANADYQHWYGTASCNMATNASMFSALGYARRCRAAYQKELELAPDSPRGYIALGSYYAQAPGVAGGDKAEALKLAEKLKQLDELQGWLLQLKATDISKQANFEALLAGSELLQQRPEAYYLRGMTLARDNKHSEAIELYQQALALTASDKEASASQVQSRYQLGRSAVLGKTGLEEGTAALQQFIQDGAPPEYGDWAQLRLGQLLLLQQQREQAEAILKPLLASTEDSRVKDELKKLL